MKGILGVTLAVILLLAGATQLPPIPLPDLSNFGPRWSPFSSQRTSPERNPSTSLKTIAAAQADFRANDRGGDGMNRFWRGDVAGLYTIVPKNAAGRNSAGPGTDAIKLIELSVASSDDRPVSDLSPYAIAAPKAGYWMRAIRHADEDPKALDPNRFAACSFPAKYSPEHRWTYILDESNAIFRADLGPGGGIDVFPSVKELDLKWTKLD
jgi:hypothetical protein